MGDLPEKFLSKRVSKDISTLKKFVLVCGDSHQIQVVTKYSNKMHSLFYSIQNQNF